MADAIMFTLVGYSFVSTTDTACNNPCYRSSSGAMSTDKAIQTNSEMFNYRLSYLPVTELVPRFNSKQLRSSACLGSLKLKPKCGLTQCPAVRHAAF